MVTIFSRIGVKHDDTGYILRATIESLLDVRLMIVPGHADILQQHLGETDDSVPTNHQVHHLAANTEHRQEQRELLDESLKILDHQAIDQTAERERMEQKNHDDGIEVVRSIFDGSQRPADRSPIAGIRQQRERQRKSVHRS